MRIEHLREFTVLAQTLNYMQMYHGRDSEAYNCSNRNGGRSAMDARERARQKLIETVVGLGHPQEFGVLIADELRTEKAMGRMTAYLRNARPTQLETIADEMLAIIAERDMWVERKISEHANATITRFYNR